MRSEWVLVGFHGRGVVRASWRMLTPILAAIAVGAGLNSDPAQWLALIAGVDRPWPTLVIWFALAWSLARWTAPRLAHVSQGCLRHLPVSASEHRRAQWWALLAAQLPVYFALAVVWIAAALAGHAASVWSWCSLPVAAIAIAWLASRAVRIAPNATRARASRWPLPFLINARASRGFSLPSAMLAPLPIAAAALFARHEPAGTPIVALAARLAGAMALSLAVAGSAETLVQHRPWWSWSRSLPETSQHRVRVDALWTGLWATPAVLAMLILFPRYTWPVLLVWPCLALVASGSIRHPGLAAAGTHTLWIGGFIAATIALWPLAALLFVPGAWLAHRLAVARDRALPVSLWDERTAPVEDAA